MKTIKYYFKETIIYIRGILSWVAIIIGAIILAPFFGLYLLLNR